MRLIHLLKKSLIEQVRDPAMLLLSLSFAPAFVLLYHLALPSWATTYRVLVLDADRPVTTAAGDRVAAGADTERALRGLRDRKGKAVLAVESVRDRADAERRIRQRDAVALVVLGEGYSAAVAAARGGAPRPGPAPVTLVGDLTQPGYAVAAVIATSVVDQTVAAATGQARPVAVTEQALGGSAGRSDFELAVPGILVFAVILLVFLAAMAVTREVETGTLRRLMIARTTAVDLLGAVSLSVVLLGVIAVLITFATAWALGFRSQGPLAVAILVAAITTLSIVGTGLIVAGFTRTVTQAFVVANFPLGLFMFFSGAMFPLPRTTLFHVAGHAVGPFDVLPPTHAVVALNKVLTLGAGLRDVAFELGALLLLSVATFGIGVLIFRRRRMRAE